MSDFEIDVDTSDIVFQDIDFEIDDGLKSAVYISLFTDVRGEVEEIEGQNPRGNWSDHFETIPLGSKLWLLSREKQTEDSRLLAEQYASDSLQWLISEGIAKSVEVIASFPTRGILYLQVKIFRPEEVEFEFSTNWEAEIGAI